jgi:hypothetical protein
VVCAWLGNNPEIAREHYLQVTDAHLGRAIGAPEKPAQNPAQSAAVPTGLVGTIKDEKSKMSLPVPPVN